VKNLYGLKGCMAQLPKSMSLHTLLLRLPANPPLFLPTPCPGNCHWHTTLAGAKDASASEKYVSTTGVETTTPVVGVKTTTISPQGCKLSTRCWFSIAYIIVVVHHRACGT
jgi:hypothetical protein